ncbi:HAMP domain-containing protein [Agrobacterium rhizogenes]|uniref:methyl-accepting chemotaxis protein n=1 Tax=Rhizobium rhizogenes TaxID=359 RepID=UPI001571A71D|nr:HAMP domain-containing methyl-accepting chemotaxis protein [Rhizobium rhizogenes]NTI06647.1 HAMP domain-containing protein [Rhizobium rhizogenes]NTI13452.1 HAMP domain-containing protein [Rhizobium rhizogenes]
MKISIKMTLFGLFGALAAVSAIQGLVSIRSLSAIGASTRSIAEDTVPSVLTLGQLNADYGDLRIEHLGYLLSEGVQQQQILADIQQTQSEIAKDIAAYLPAVTSDKERSIYEQYVDASASYDQIWRRAKALKDGGQDSEAAALLLGDGKTAYNKAGDTIQKDVDQNTADNKVNLDNTDVAIGYSLTSAYLAFGLAMIVAFAAMILSLSRIIKPLSRMTAYMGLLSTGDTTKDVPGRDRHDEIGAMATAVEVFREAAITNSRLEGEAHVMRERQDAERAAVQKRSEMEAEQLRFASDNIGAGLKRLAAGELAFQLNEAFAPDFEPLRHDFNQSVLQLGTALSAIAESIATMGNGTREIASGAQDLARRTEQQAASLEETAAALDQITVNVSSSTKRTDEARTVATQANQSAAKSTEVVSHAEEAMRRIEESSQQISNIIGVIDEIAFQTNLLALNAGVEAARAGDAGKGFAVVAQEVRELAQRSAQAAKEIKGLIHNSSVEVESGVKLVRDTGEALKDIGSFIGQINSHMNAIAVSAKEQSTGLAEINMAVNSMDQSTQQNAAMVEESTAAASSLALEAGKLRDLVARFKLEGTASQPRAADRTSQPVTSPARSLGNRLASAFGGRMATAAAAKEWEEF